MRYWYDTEFYEDGSTIDLISFGMVAEDGRELYLENAGFNWYRVPKDHWLWENVYPHLTFEDKHLAYRPSIADRIRQFVTLNGTEFNNQLWGYYSAYDHVVLAQLFGRMVDMPEGVPWFTMDVKQYLTQLQQRTWVKLELPKQTSTEHHALADAKWTKEAWEYLEDTRRRIVFGAPDPS